MSYASPEFCLKCQSPTSLCECETTMPESEYPIDVLKRMVPPLIDVATAARKVWTQGFGLRKAWAGMYEKCPSCAAVYAYGGNWATDKGQCPYCELEAALIAYGASAK
jgi:hypothetical protein